MRFDIYCDESRPDLLSTKHPTARFMVIGSLWLASDDRQAFKDEIHALRDKHRIGGEFKWQKVSPSRAAFYTELVEWFCAKGDRLRFRCIAVEQQKIDLVKFHDGDQELGFYKFYYEMLHQWILDFNEYAVFCDFKRNRARDRLHVLQRCLSSTNLSSVITSVQAIPSEESVLIQLTDILTGVAAARLNDILTAGSAKTDLVARLERCLDRRIGHTMRGEPKFNVFVINLQGGW